MKIITYFLSLILQRLTPFAIHIYTNISLSIWKMKLMKIGAGTVNQDIKIFIKLTLWKIGFKWFKGYSIKYWYWIFWNVVCFCSWYSENVLPTIYCNFSNERSIYKFPRSNVRQKSHRNIFLITTLLPFPDLDI